MNKPSQEDFTAAQIVLEFVEEWLRANEPKAFVTIKIAAEARSGLSFDAEDYPMEAQS